MNKKKGTSNPTGDPVKFDVPEDNSFSYTNRAFTTETLIGTPYELMTLACESCGLELAMRKRDFAAFANGQRELSLYADNDIQTWRDCVSWIAQAIGCNVFANRDGKIVLRDYGQNVVDTSDTNHQFTGITFDDYETHYTGLSVVDAANQMTRYYSLPEDDGLTYAEHFRHQARAVFLFLA